MVKYGALISIFLVSYVPRTIIATCDPDRFPELHDEARLHEDVMCAYNSDYRPVKDHRSAVTIKVRFALKYISFDALEETFTLHSWVAMSWKDEFINWNPSDYGDIKELQIESHRIWTPRMSLFNADASLYQPESIYTTCLVESDGTVTCVPHMVHSGICRTSLASWPYDVQNCSFYFGSWMHTGQQVNFTFYNTRPIVMDDYQDGPGWKLLNVSKDYIPGVYTCCPNSSYPMLKYTFMMKREAGGPAAIVVVPSVVIVLLTLTAQFLDVKDSIRLLLLCFSLFSHFSFLSEIGYDIPKHSADTPLILYFVRDSMIVTLFAIFVTLVLMSIRKRDVPAPTWIVSLNRIINSGPGKYVVFTEFDPSDAHDVKVLAEGNISDDNVNEKSRITADWMQLANILNSLVFIITLITYLVLLSSYIPRN